MLNAGVPVGFVIIICNWYGKMSAAVRWGNAMSNSFHVGSGVRQGGSLSPTLFNTFINLLIVKLKIAGIGCHIDDVFLGCFFICIRFDYSFTICTWTSTDVRYVCFNL